MNTHKSEVGGQRSEVKIEMRDPADLRLHKLQRHIPDPDKKSAEWAAFVDALQATGANHLPALIITDDGQIMDGGWRWRGAKQLNWPEIKCEVQPENRAGVIIVETLIHRKQMTRGAAIYMVLPLLKDFVESAESRRLSNLRAGNKTREIPLFSPNSSTLTIGRSAESITQLCQQWGVSPGTYNRARQVHEIFAKSPDLKKEWEPRLLSGEKNLWNVLSAIGGAGADQSGRDSGVVSGQLELFKDAFADFKKAARGWKKFEADQRHEVLQTWRKTVAELPQDMRDAMIEALMKEAK